MGSKRQDINDVALTYMEQKYGEKFEYAAPQSDVLAGTHEFWATCDSLPGRKVIVQIENYRSDTNKIFRDNYIAIKYEDESAEFFRNCATNVFGEAEVFYEVANGGQSAELPADATLEEYLADTRVPFVIMIEVKESDFLSKEQAGQVGESIAESGADFFLTLVVVEDSVYGTFTRKTLNEQIPLRQFIECASVTKLNDEITTDWLRKE